MISTGGTGLTGRDVTPEAMRPLFDKTIEGFETVWHMISYQSVGLSTMQAAPAPGWPSGTLIFSLPGSNGACKDGWDKVIRWQLDSRYRPCNLVELMPRFHGALMARAHPSGQARRMPAWWMWATSRSRRAKRWPKAGCA